VFNNTIIKYRVILFALLLFISVVVIKGHGFDFKGQFSSWGAVIRSQNDWGGNSGIRYIPQFNYSYSPGENDLLNTEVLLNTYYTTNSFSDDYTFKFYRAILRYSTSQSEIQLGLQKINFGPAQLLRPLMWFDKTDPRDPLKLTDGVYALRYKYSFLDNSILWLWCLFGNIDTKGYEICPTANNVPEFGGRIQSSILEGEIAATFHTRKVNANFFGYRENRYAVDGRWDIGVGLWFESVWQQNISDLQIYKWNRMTTFGTDYTFPVGNGLYFLAEHMSSAVSYSFGNSDKDMQISAMMMTYSLGVLDNLTLQEYYDWHNKNLYQYFQLQRIYDNFIINVALFHYPANGENLFFTSNTSLLSGYGLQLMLIYNY